MSRFFTPRQIMSQSKYHDSQKHHDNGQILLPNSDKLYRLRSLWAKVLHQDDDFSEDDVFFEVGGDSISAVELAVAAQHQGIALDVEQIFTHASLQEMAQCLSDNDLATGSGDEREHGSGNIGDEIEPFSLLDTSHIEQRVQLALIASACGVEPDKVRNAYPCTPMQESLVAVSGDKPNAYVRQLVYKLADNVLLNRFRQAWEETIQANPILRTRIVHLGNQHGFVQAELDFDIKSVPWTMGTDLTRYLLDDAERLMTPGDPFFRYAIVTEGHHRRFIWTVHHSLCDGASVAEVLSDVARRLHGDPSVQHLSFDRFVASTVFTQQSKERKFWDTSLTGTAATPYPPVPLSLDYRPDATTVLVRRVNLPQAQFGLTKALLLRAAWGILLSSHTGTKEVLFGAVVNGRNASAVAGLSQTLGPTISLIPIVMSVDPKQSVADFLTEVRDQAAQLMAFEQTGISRIRQILASHGSRVADFQSLFVIHWGEHGEVSALQKLGLIYDDHVGKREQHPYPLIVTLTLSAKSATEVKFQMEFDERIIATQHAGNLISQFQAVLIALGNATTETLLESISPLSEEDLSQIREWNQHTPPTSETSIHDLFRQQVFRQPHAEAVCSVDQSLTYAEVENMSSTLALRLIKEFNVEHNSFIGVCFEKNIYTIVAILAIFKAGAVYVPIDPAHPRSRINEVIQTVQIKVAVTSVVGAEVLEGLCDRIVVLHDPPLSFVSGFCQQLLTSTPPASNAYLLFTSGSTGVPKGLLMSHSAICTSILHHGPAFGAGPHWRTLQFGSHTFDLSIGEFFTTLSFGGCVCVPSEQDRQNDLAKAITTLNVNTLLVVPTVANLLHPKDVSTLKTIVLAGEPITKETIIRWAPHVQLTAAYGPSETAVWCSGNLNVPVDADPANIGRAIGSTMWIVNPDNHNELKAIGCVGEIAISGGLVGNGYFRDKAISEASFVAAPEWMKMIQPRSPFKVIYKSGDLARYNPDGTFHIVGRKDTQVKLRGFRIELGEIENRIMEHDVVKATLVCLPTEGPCARRLVAFVSFNKSNLASPSTPDVVLADDSQRQIAQRFTVLKSHLKFRLPEYMLPSIWVALNELPLLISGKIDRKTLKSWISSLDEMTYKAVLDVQDDFTEKELTAFEPGNPASVLRELWGQVFGVSLEHITMDTSFFSLGGDSISAIQMVAEAKRLGLSLNVRSIITSRTIRNLATLVDTQGLYAAPPPRQQLRTRAVSSAVITHDHEELLKARIADRPVVKVEDIFLLAPIQSEILRQRAINSAVFLLSWVMIISPRGPQAIDLARLARSWKLVVRKHLILRTIFLQRDLDGNAITPIQAVLSDDAEPNVAVSTSWPNDDDNLDKVLPPVDQCFLPHRAHFAMYRETCIAHIEFDHLVIDGWSLKLIKEDLLAAYDLGEVLLSKPAPSYRDFVDAHQLSKIDAAETYWYNAFQGQPPSRLPRLPVHLKKHDSVQLFSPEKTILHLPVLRAQSLATFSTHNYLTASSIIDAAWAETIVLATGVKDVSFEYVISGRDREEVPGVFSMVGPLLNVLAYHLRDVSTDDSPQALARLSHIMQDQRMQDGQHPNCNLREALAGHQTAPELPFNTAVNFQRRPTAVKSEKLTLDDDLTRSKDPWHFEVLVRVIHVEDDDTLRLSMEFDRHAFAEDEMQRVLDIFWGRLRRIVDWEC